MSRKKYIDRTDLELLNTLKANPGMTVAQLGNEVDLTPGPTHTRLIRLEEDGFFKSTIEVDYSKFGVLEHAFTFLLKEDTQSVMKPNPEKTYKKIITLLNKAKESLITSVELFIEKNEEQHWISIRYFPRYSEEIIKQRASKEENKVSNLDEITALLSSYIDSESMTLQLVSKDDLNPELGIGNMIRKKPE